jgi:phage recombination protein Bet
VTAVDVFQEGTSQRHTARCECGWQTSVGTMKAAQALAREHRQAGCVEHIPPGQQLAPTTQTVEPAGSWTEEQNRILKKDLGIKTDGDLAYFAQVAAHKNLDPFLGEILPVYYGGQLTIQDTVEGLRTIAERSGLYDGFDGPHWCGPDLDWKRVWLADEPPAAARYSVRRKDWSEPVTAVARWKSSVQLGRDGKPLPIWRDRPDEMLGKTAEVRALKRAFPKEFARAGLSVRDLTDAQIVTVEARRAGLDDDARHALVAEVTGGRTTSTRDLTDDEQLAVRAEVARLKTDLGADPETGEIIDEAPPAEPQLPLDAVGRTVARTSGALEEILSTLNPDQLQALKEWRRSKGLVMPVATMTPDQRKQITGELARRGWGLEPPAPDNDDYDDPF